MRPKILVVGSFNTDLVLYMPQLPQIGETVDGHRFMTGPGGKGSNQAIGAARLGADVTFIGRIGKDAFAHVGQRLWEQEHIHTDYVIVDDHNPTGIASIFVEDSGENMIALAPGANAALNPADIDAAAQAFVDADLLLIQLEIPLSTVIHTLRMARAHDILTILNPAPARGSLPSEMIALADFITPNETEIEHLNSQHNGTAEVLAKNLLQDEKQTVIVTMGSWGVMWVQQHAEGHVPAFNVDAVDSVGAGDAFNAGLAVALAEKKPLDQALRFANAAAALSVTKKGAASSMPQRAQVDAFLAAHPDEDEK